MMTNEVRNKVPDAGGVLIKQLLAYQEKDKERLGIIAGVETGRHKREIDTANRAIDEAKQNLLALENDAKALQGAYESSARNLKEIFDRIEQFKKQAATKSEDEIQSAASYVSALLNRVSGYENQLDDISKKIASKQTAFEDAKTAVIRAQKNIAAITPGYAAAQKEIQPKLSAVDAELCKLASGIDSVLLEKYKHRRKSDKSGKNIVVPVSGNRCGGCFFEMPLSLVHKISTDGYIICEECQRIIYK